MEGSLELRGNFCFIVRQGNSKVGMERNTVAQWSPVWCRLRGGVGPCLQFLNPGLQSSYFPCCYLDRYYPSLTHSSKFKETSIHTGV
ncbi:unnamed protein product [Gulo gulo]|uniref:Uncharacterized protein n=1 Tax=Gulo gulo TaxID=48420 RepID=A0A9X9PZE9_GULGU|nr:unnamed protein product [Gulo gulo]